MPQCPDCDSIRIFSELPEGNGKCSACHGTGFNQFLDAGIMEMLNGEQPSCEECLGTGQCPTCTGTGVVEEFEITLAA
jgi:DnaJ-class molecular chaperone